MGCGLSKPELEEIGQGYRIRTRRGRTISTNIEEYEDESDSSTNRRRKSVSSMAASEGGTFSRRVVEKERGVKRDVTTDSNHRDISLKQNSFSLKTDNNNVNTLYLETMKKETMKESKIDDNKEVEKQQKAINDDDEEDYIRASNVVSGIMFGPSSPSFREYCVHNDFSPSINEEGNDDEERESDKSTQEIEKGQSSRRRARGLKNAIHMGGSVLRSVFVPKGGSAVARRSSESRRHDSAPHEDTK